MTSTTPKANAPGDPVPQLNLLVLATEDDRLSRGDLGILGKLIKRYRKDKGNAWADHEMLAELANLSKRQVIRSVQRLVDLGYVTVVDRGVRGRASVYVPSFNLVLGDTDVTKSPLSFGDTDVTLTADLGDADVTAYPEKGDMHVTPSHLRLSPTGAQTLSEGLSVATPGVGGPSAAPPGGTEGFEEVYLTYGVKLDRAKALAAYQSMAPSAEQHAAMLAAAKAWRVAYDGMGRESTYRKRLATWLTGKCWLEDGPAPLPSARNPRTAKADGDVIRITRARVTEGAGQDILTLDYEVVSDGSTRSYSFLTSTDAEQLDRFLADAGLRDIGELSEFEGVTMTRKKDGRGQYHFTPATLH